FPDICSIVCQCRQTSDSGPTRFGECRARREKDMAMPGTSAPRTTEPNSREAVVNAPQALASHTSEAGSSATEAAPPLHAVHTPNFPTLLRELGASLL